MSDHNRILRTEPLAELRISTLPGKDSFHGVEAVVEVPSGLADGLAVATLQLLEEAEYKYEFLGPEVSVRIEPSEMFSPSSSHGRSGRLRTRRSTGTVAVIARTPEGSLVGTCEIEVRSRKLDYLTEYRRMLQRVADEAAEAVQWFFAASSLPAFSPATSGEAETLYQRFAFVQALIGAAEFQSSLQTIISRPHKEFAEVETSVDPGRGLRGSSQLHRELMRSGRRQPADHDDLGLRSIPVTVRRADHAPTFDTVPNRFVRHALRQWRNLADDVARACARRSGRAAVRGRSEAAALKQEIDRYLSAGVFVGVADLATLPVGNTVLQRGAGYRDVFRAYLQVEAAARVDWAGGAAFAAGQRDVATLYEYWVFLEVARTISEVPGVTLDRRALFQLSDDGLALALCKGETSVLRGVGHRYGGNVSLELWFNREFDEESWTRTMIPDCSLRVTWCSRVGRLASKWLHFDAKYRMRSAHEVMVGSDVNPGVQAAPLPENLLKMHAYRDAIRRTSGAYVLYPGYEEDPLLHPEFHEVLPGLGAFVMRPGPDGRAYAAGSLTLRQFLDDVIDHLAANGTDERRADYWTELVREQRAGEQLVDPDWGNRPPADTQVLLGYVRGEAHLSWIRRTALYNLRADDRPGSVDLASRELTSDVVILYGTGELIAGYAVESTVRVMSNEDLIDSGYPDEPGGNVYCCIVLGRPLPVPVAITANLVRDIARRDRPRGDWAAPCVSTLTDLLRAAHDIT